MKIYYVISNPGGSRAFLGWRRGGNTLALDVSASALLPIYAIKNMYNIDRLSGAYRSAAQRRSNQ